MLTLCVYVAIESGKQLKQTLRNIAPQANRFSKQMANPKGCSAWWLQLCGRRQWLAPLASSIRTQWQVKSLDYLEYCILFLVVFRSVVAIPSKGVGLHGEWAPYRIALLAQCTSQMIPKASSQGIPTGDRGGHLAPLTILPRPLQNSL